MDEKQAALVYATHKRMAALPLIFISVIAGLFTVVLFPDCGWAGAIPGGIICVLTGWAAIVLLASASKVVEGRKADRLEALFADPQETPQPAPVSRIEAEEESAPVSVATGLGILAIVLFGVLRLAVHLGKADNQRPGRNPPMQGQQQKPQIKNFPVESENGVRIAAMLLGAKLYSEKGKDNVAVIDFSSNSSVEDSDLERYSHHLPHIRILDLRNTHVTDAGIQHLEKLQTLRKLRLGGTSVTPEQISALQAALPECVIDTKTE